MALKRIRPGRAGGFTAEREARIEETEAATKRFVVAAKERVRVQAE
jgi:hypothetical protein